MEFDAAHKTWCGVQVIFKINGHLFKFTYHIKPYNSYTVVTFGTVYKTFKCKAASYTCVLEVALALSSYGPVMFSYFEKKRIQWKSTFNEQTQTL